MPSRSAATALPATALPAPAPCGPTGPSAPTTAGSRKPSTAPAARSPGPGDDGDPPRVLAVGGRGGRDHHLPARQCHGPRDIGPGDRRPLGGRPRALLAAAAGPAGTAADAAPPADSPVPPRSVPPAGSVEHRPGRVAYLTGRLAHSEGRHCPGQGGWPVRTRRARGHGHVYESSRRADRPYPDGNGRDNSCTERYGNHRT